MIRKKKGMLTFEEVFRFMHERDMVNIFNGSLVVAMFRVHDELDTWAEEFHEKPEGDEQGLFIIWDDADCPICGEHKLFPQYCPECGHEVKVKINGR